MNLTSDMNHGASSLIRPTRYPLPTQAVETMTLFDLFHQEKIENCDLLKIDIEGWEYEAIMGSMDLFKEHRVKTLALELHPTILAKRGLSSQKIIDRLNEYNYHSTNYFGNLVFVSSLD